MGSIQEARIAGFLCRLCSEMHRIVIHIYGEEGLKNNLAKKINGYLPVKVIIYSYKIFKCLYNFSIFLFIF